jgi:adenosylhomocysteine nucleosidase
MSIHFITAVKEELDGAMHILDIPVHYCGVGKVNAAIGTFELIKRGATEIINLGSCGSLLQPLGEIIKIGKVFQDIDASPLSPYGETPFEDGPHFIDLDPGSSVTCFTTDYFYDHTQKSKYSPSYVNSIQRNSVFDMELYAIAKVCRMHQVKCSAFKWVSDDGNFEHWQENCRGSVQKFIHLFNEKYA